MKLLLPLIVVALIALAVYCTVRAIKARQEASLRWTMDEIERGDYTEVWIVKGKSRDRIARIDRMLADYDDQVLSARSEAEDKILTRNALLDSKPRQLSR